MGSDVQAAPAPATPAAVPAAAAPRYRIVAEEAGRGVLCESAPNIRVRVERGLTVGVEELKKYPRQSIFLDGACSGPPFLDNENRHYSFDHHAGNVPRAFLLAACEQAAVMILEGLPLDDGNWQVFINNPDLDAALAAWLLVNHAPLKLNHAKLLAEVMPLVRVEGVIDAHGTDAAPLSGLPLQLWDHYRRELDELKRREDELKGTGAWAQADLLDYTRGLFERLDALLLPAGHLAEISEIKELGRVNLDGGKVVISCRSRQAIYAVEERLRERFGPSLALILLDAGNGIITLRQADQFLPRNLNHLYSVLNQRDPQATKGNLWGGSSEIGGSPRKSGTGLSAEELLAVVREVYGPRPPWWKRLFRKR
jgi:hypothetical protein